MIEIFVLGSGSNGNSLLLSFGNEKILIDAGLSAKKIIERIEQNNININNVSGIVITHEHGDHIRSAHVLSKRYNIPVYMNKGTLRAVKKRFIDIDVRIFQSNFSVGNFKLIPFPLSHDASEPVGFIIIIENYRLGLLTDTGILTNRAAMELQRLDGLFLETNYDDDIIKNSHRPSFVINRITGNKGHLSNKNAADILKRLNLRELRFLVLYHISKDHNTPMAALNALKPATKKLNSDIKIYLAKREHILRIGLD